jgi:hypothetical protein
MRPYEKDDLKAYTVSKSLSDRTANTNIPEILEEEHYRELDFIELDDFL